MLPFAMVRHGKDDVPVLLGTASDGTLAGLDLVEGRFLALEPGDVGAVMDTDPAAVFYGMQMMWSRREERMAAEEGEYRGPTWWELRFRSEKQAEAFAHASPIAGRWQAEWPPSDPTVVRTNAPLHVIDEALKEAGVHGPPMHRYTHPHYGAAEEFHGSDYCLPVGTILKPAPGKVRYHGPVETALEAGRPRDMIKRSEAVYMTKLKSGVFHAGGGASYVYRVEPIGKLYGPFDGGWFNKVKIEQIYGGDKRTASMVESYWSGKRCRGDRSFDCFGATEYLAHEARIVEVLRPSNADAQTCSGKYQGDMPTRLREEAPVIPLRKALGMRFSPLLTADPFSVPITGFSDVRSQLLKHRETVPTIETIRMTTIFAGMTVGVGIAQAEHGFKCLAELFEHGEPPIEQVRACIWSLGYHQIRERLYNEAPRWAPVAQEAIRRGLRDRELREHLFLHTDLPAGISLAKLSFVLALLGHDVVCLDVRILDRMFGPHMASKYSDTWSTHKSQLSLQRYERTEDAFLRGNAFYRPTDPIGRARAQWMAWESAGKPARIETHSTWLDVVRGA